MLHSRSDHHELQGFTYDPMSPHAEIMNFADLVRLDRMSREGQEKIKVKFAQIFVVGVLLAVLVEFQKFGLGLEHFVSGWEVLKFAVAFFIAWELLANLVNIKYVLEGARVELGRLRFSATSGNLCSLLMKLEERTTYIERRSLE